MLIDTNDLKGHIIQEMFILNNYKKQGFGKLAIKALLKKHKGKWTVKSLPKSENSEKFWINTIKDITENKCNVEYIGKFNRAVLTFENE